MRIASLWSVEGLAARVAGTLALALLPIGAIAIYQAVEINRDESRRQEIELLTATAEAAFGEALAIAGASGVAATLAAHVVGEGGSTGAECSTMFENIVKANPRFSFAGFMTTDGIVACASTDVGRDMTGGAVHPRITADMKPLVVANPKSPISDTSVITTATPVFLDDVFAGYVSVSVPHRRIHGILHGASKDIVSDILTYNAKGTLLSVNDGMDDVASILPRGRTLASLVSNLQDSFQTRTETGERRSFATVPVIPGVLYALGSRPSPQPGWASIAPVLFPALMLIAGLIVALVSVNRLVIRHIHRLIRHMAEFTCSRRVRSLADKRGLARELVEIDAAWIDLAERCLRDEAELENAVHEKNVLLKELHHRVKNNLQLIASIVNLKYRRANTPETRRILKEVQGRVTSIATVHQLLYANPTAGVVRADELLGSVVDAMIEAGKSTVHSVDIRRSFDPVLLYPDQAVPFLLLASEAVTNALKYMGRLADGVARLDLRLETLEDGQAKFSVINTVGTPLYPLDEVKGSGLGHALLAGLSTQVGGRIEQAETETQYSFQLTFTPVSFDPGERDTVIADLDHEPGAPQS